MAAESTDDAELSSEPPGYGGRTLADIHAFSTRTSFSLFSQGSGDSLDLYPGLTVYDQDFLDRGYQAYAGFFLEDAIFSLSFPNLMGNNWILTARLFVPYSAELRGSSALIDGTLRDTSVRTRQDSLTLSLAVPLSRRFSLGAGYTLSQLGFEAVDGADPSFVTPGDTREHLIDLSVNGRFGGLSTELGLKGIVEVVEQALAVRASVRVLAHLVGVIAIDTPIEELDPLAIRRTVHHGYPTPSRPDRRRLP